jgi:endoglucanase
MRYGPARRWASRRCAPLALFCILALPAACADVVTGLGEPRVSDPLLDEGAMPDRPFFHGVFLGDDESRPGIVGGAIAEFRDRSGSAPALVKTFQTLDSDFSPGGWAGRVVREIAASGSTNLIALDLRWEGAPAEPLLSVLARGAADDRLDRLARDLAKLGELVLVEPAWEMNGDWRYPWQGVTNGGGPDAALRFVEAWRHVVDVFRDNGAANVRWVFSPNVGNPVAGRGAGAAHWNWYGHYYPGDAHVDYVGAHGFHAPALWDTPYQDFSTLFDGEQADRLLSDLAGRFPGKPIIISEFAAEETPGRDKGSWIEAAFRHLHRHPAVIATVWFNMRKEADWRIESSASALAAYRAAVGSPRARTRFLES